MATYRLTEVYGFKDGDIEDIASDIADALQIEFRRRESVAYHGLHFGFDSDQTGAVDDLGFILLHNEHPIDYTRVCEFAPDCRYVLTVAQDGRESKVEAGLMSMSRNRPELLERVLHDKDTIERGKVQFRRDESP